MGKGITVTRASDTPEYQPRRVGIYVVEAIDVNTGETVRKVVLARSASLAQEVAQFSGEAEVGRLGDFDPGFVGARFNEPVIATQITPKGE